MVEVESRLSKKKVGEKTRRSEKSSAKAEDRAGVTTTRLADYLQPTAVLDIIVDDKASLLRSLAEVVVPDADAALIDQIYASMSDREATVSTFVGEGVAIPQARVEALDGIHLALARNAQGLPYDLEAEELVHIVALVVGPPTLKDELVAVLGHIARVLKDDDLRAKIIEAPDGAAVCRLVDSSQKRAVRKRRPLSDLLLSHAGKIARELRVSSVIVAVDNRRELLALKRLRRREPFIVATADPAIAEEARDIVPGVLLLPGVNVRHDARVRLTAFMALSHGLVKRGDSAAFLSGEEAGLNSMTVLEMGRDVGRFVSASGELSRGVQPIVVERIIAIATELASEGREGKPVGTIFVVGDAERLEEHCQQMVMNPFRGYPEEERNILDPTLTESIKEFAAIDGAFVVRGDGVVLSAGTYLRVSLEVDLPGGYGSRHRVACAITQEAPCIAVALSQSTGEVSVFKKGGVVLTLPRGSG